jgi:DNA invertase Pin-like site-specific DNA recombinase
MGLVSVLVSVAPAVGGGRRLGLGQPLDRLELVRWGQVGVAHDHLEGSPVDRGFSGAKDSRPALNRLMADAHRRRFDTVLVWKLDRFGRSLRHLVNALAELEAKRIAFVSLKDNLDLYTPSGRLMFQIIGAMAEFERALIVERVKAGMRNAKAKGKRIGRPPRTYLGEDTRHAIALAYQRGEGSLRELAARFSTSVGTIQRCVRVYQKVAGPETPAS